MDLRRGLRVREKKRQGVKKADHEDGGAREAKKKESLRLRCVSTQANCVVGSPESGLRKEGVQQSDAGRKERGSKRPFT